MAEKDLTYGAASVRRILRKLEKPEELAQQYAEAILAQAVRNAASRPTPQAPMAAANLDVQGASIGPSAGGAPAAVAIGSEFGSSQYLQFQHSPVPRGLWLYPAAEDESVIMVADVELQKIVDSAIRTSI